MLWRIVQDHEQANLLFLGTEFGVYFTLDGAKTWNKLSGGMPTISVRDLAIQKRENDLVAGTFGRGIYILDDYSFLREFNSTTASEAQLFTPRNGKWYTPKRTLGGGKKASQGDNFFVADNPPYGVVIHYYLKNKYLSKKEQREKKEKKAEKANKTISVPEWEVLEKENAEIAPKVWLFIYNNKGDVLRKLSCTNKKGFNQVSWDLSTESPFTITSKNKNSKQRGHKVAPGNYYAKLFKQINGSFSAISEQVAFEVILLQQNSLTEQTPENVVEHWKNMNAIQAKANDFGLTLKQTKEQVLLMLKAYEKAKSNDDSLHNTLLTTRSQLLTIEQQYSGSKTRSAPSRGLP